MNIIGLDIGTVRIGVARADSKVRIAVPAGMIPVDGSELEQLARLSRVYNTTLFVLGLPRNNEGEETKQSTYVREFAKSLKAKIPGAKICFQDESLTSVTAEERLKYNGKSIKAKRAAGDIDAEAAVIILQDFLEHFTEKTGGKLPKAAKKQTSKALEKQKTHSHRKLILSLIIACLVIVMGAVAASIFYFLSLGAPRSEDCSEVSISIPSGASTADIAGQLADNNLIQNSFTFQIFTKLNGYDGEYKSGNYTFQYCSEASQIASQLAAGVKDEVFSLTILPGETISSIKAKLAQLGYELEDIDAAFAAEYDHPVLADKPAGQSLEGYIYGDTYEFYRRDSVDTIIRRTLDELYANLQEEGLIEAYAAQGLSLHNAITLASVVQKEASPADMPGVAQVFLTRLASGIQLGSDVTTIYSLDLLDPERNIYTDNAAALQVEECHNTRLYTGLPCGPISNPGLAALRAVANPSDNTYLYFLTGDDGVMYYSYTESEHQQNIRDHCQELCAVAL